VISNKEASKVTKRKIKGNNRSSSSTSSKSDTSSSKSSSSSRSRSSSSSTSSDENSEFVSSLNPKKKKKGIFDIKTIEKCFKPLFAAKDIALDINMEDFYNLTKIELHIFSFEINEYKVVDISYKTFPKLEILKAIQMSCALPVLVTPVCIDDKCFMDGGVGCNYPLSFCIDSGKEPDEILGFKNKYSDEKSNINVESSLLDYILNFLFKAVLNVHNNYVQPIIKNEVICDTSHLTIDTLKSALTSIDVRRELFEKGRLSANKFLDSLQDRI
jgi:predicted acylesterase/phospholipase RssA